MGTDLLELRGGPLDGRRVRPSDIDVLPSGWMVVTLRSAQRGMVRSHFYSADGQYHGASRPRRRTTWQRLCEWWAGE